jgi:hypothetical protein
VDDVVEEEQNKYEDKEVENERKTVEKYRERERLKMEWRGIMWKRR